MKIAIIGTGNMGSSLIEGLIKNGHASNAIWAADAKPDKLNHLRNKFNINCTSNNSEAALEADVIVMAVKPQIFQKVAIQIATVVQNKSSLLISIAAGIRISSIQTWLGENISIIRCMPNTPALIGCGASALFANEFVTSEQKEYAGKILRSVGITVWLKDEKQIDIVTALSGSGPAYFFLIMEALQDAAVAYGLDEKIARTLVQQTALGSARMATETSASLLELRQNVTSPGGTTEKGIAILEKENLRQTFRKALQAAKLRAEEIAELNA